MSKTPKEKASAPPQFSPEEMRRYSRHLMLDEFGEAGQAALAAARVGVIGLGGLGCPAALYLAVAGAGALVLCDDDEVDLTNLQRQILHDSEGVGLAKTESAARRLRAANPAPRLLLKKERVTESNISALLKGCDVVVDGSDNFSTRHLVNRWCAAQKTPLIFGAAAGWDGQLAVFDFRREESPCYACLFPEDAAAEDTPCALLGVFSPLTGMLGAMMAGEAVKAVINNAEMPPLQNTLLLADARNLSVRAVKIRRDDSCAVCGKK